MNSYNALYLQLAKTKWGGGHNIIRDGISFNVADSIIRYKNEVIEWLNSDDFKEYENLKYPPLINPSTINYKTLNASDAYFLNIPLPNYFNFICFGSHGVGFTALKYFLKLCDCIEIDSYQIDNSYHTYVALYNQLIHFNNKQANNKTCYISLRNLIADSDKIYHLIPKSKALSLVSDPINMLKTYINNKTQNKIFKTINLTYNPKMIAQNIIKYGFINDLQESPSTNLAPFWIFYRFMTFHDSLLENHLKVDTHYVDVSQITGKKTFNTIKALAEKFKFNPPKEQDKNEFCKKISTYNGFLPINIMLHQNDLELIKQYGFCNSPNSLNNNDLICIQLTTKFELQADMIDITNALSLNLGDIVVAIDHNNYNLLANNVLLATQASNYIRILAREIENQLDIENKKRIDVKHILEYLKSNKEIKDVFYKTIKSHIKNIENTQPKMIDSWKEYNKFLKLTSH